MDIFGSRDLRTLIAPQPTPCVSIFMPTHVASEQGQQDPVRLKNLLDQAEDQLVERWERSAEARSVLAEARELSSKPSFWKRRSNGMAMFLAPGGMWHYRLPLSFDEHVFVGRRFHVKPLLPLLTGGDRFYLLALSQNNVRLFIASRFTIAQIQVPGLPHNMEESLNLVGADRGSQVHSAMRGSRGKQAGVFHGQGGEPDTAKEELTQFFRLVDASLHDVFCEETTPVLLAGVEYLLPIYRQVSSYPHLAERSLVGNCDHLPDNEIHRRAWPIVEPTFQRSIDSAVTKYHDLTATARTSCEIGQVLAACHAGRVETLFVDKRALQWGCFNPQTAHLELHDEPEGDDEDLLDLCAVQTIGCRGTVYAVDREQIPGGSPIAAILRY